MTRKRTALHSECRRSRRLARRAGVSRKRGRRRGWQFQRESAYPPYPSGSPRVPSCNRLPRATRKAQEGPRTRGPSGRSHSDESQPANRLRPRGRSLAYEWTRATGRASRAASRITRGHFLCEMKRRDDDKPDHTPDTNWGRSAIPWPGCSRAASRPTDSVAGKPDGTLAGRGEGLKSVASRRQSATARSLGRRPRPAEGRWRAVGSERLPFCRALRGDALRRAR